MKRKSLRNGKYIFLTLHVFTIVLLKDLTQNVVSPAKKKNERCHNIKVINTLKNATPEVQANKQQIFEEAVQDFESQCKSLSQFYCQSCQMTGITIKQSRINRCI